MTYIYTLMDAFKININDREREWLIKNYEQEIPVKEKKLHDLMQEIAVDKQRLAELLSIRNTINHAAPKLTFSFPKSDSVTLSKKVEHVLTGYGKIANTRKLAELIFAIEPERGHDLKDLVSNIGATLYQKVKKSDTFNRIFQYDDIFYGLKDWFNPDGAVKDEYQVNPERAYVERSK